MDDTVDTFTTLTQAPANVAERYLGMTDGNVEQAIQLYFDSPDLASGIADPQPQPVIPNSTHPSHATGSRQDPIHALPPSTTDDEDMDYISGDDAAAAAAAVGRAADFEDDEAVARRLQEEMYTGGSSTGGFGEDGVRAPIARTTETLVGGPGGHFDDDDDDDIHARVLEQMRARRQPRQQGMPHTLYCLSHVHSLSYLKAFLTKDQYLLFGETTQRRNVKVLLVLLEVLQTH